MDEGPKILLEGYESLADSTIMIVDDESITMDVVQAYLEEHGFRKFVLTERASVGALPSTDVSSAAGIANAEKPPRGGRLQRYRPGDDSVAERTGDGAESAREIGTEVGDRQEPDDGNQHHEEGVFHHRCAPFGFELLIGGFVQV